MPVERHFASAERFDIHNVSVDEMVARAGLCGFIHLPTGRTCILPARHPGSCSFESHPKAKHLAETMQQAFGSAVPLQH
jgi:hypothetical protein